MKTQLLDKIAGKSPGVPDSTGPYGRGAGPGGGRADGSGLLSSIPKEEFIKRYLQDVPEDQREEFLARFFKE